MQNRYLIDPFEKRTMVDSVTIMMLLARCDLVHLERIVKLNKERNVKSSMFADHFKISGRLVLKYDSDLAILETCINTVFNTIYLAANSDHSNIVDLIVHRLGVRLESNVKYGDSEDNIKRFNGWQYTLSSNSLEEFQRLEQESIANNPSLEHRLTLLRQQVKHVPEQSADTVPMFKYDELRRYTLEEINTALGPQRNIDEVLSNHMLLIEFFRDLTNTTILERGCGLFYNLDIATLVVMCSLDTEYNLLDFITCKDDLITSRVNIDYLKVGGFTDVSYNNFIRSHSGGRVDCIPTNSTLQRWVALSILNRVKVGNDFTELKAAPEVA